MSGRTARRASCAFAACVAASDLLTVVCLYCVAVGCAVSMFVEYVMVCILHAVIFPHYVLCSGLNADIAVMFAIPCCLFSTLVALTNDVVLANAKGGSHREGGKEKYRGRERERTRKKYH